MLERLRRRGAPQRPAPTAPPGRRIYAIGDLHGRRDLLDKMHELLRIDAAHAPEAEKVVIYIGDYIDRGDNSRGVIELLIRKPLDGFRAVHLMGNHEAFLLRFLEDASIAPNWLANGGDATLLSYGVPIRFTEFDAIQAQFRRELPQSHLAFLRRLALSHIEGDYMFAHAGIRPGRDVTQQDAQDLMWIRDEFLGSNADHGKVVVHGHSISPEPQFLDNRIGIDTGAFATGKLTCLVLEGTSRRILQT